MRIKRALLYLQRILTPEEKPNPVSSLRICWYLLNHLKFDRVWHAFDPAPDPLPDIDELWFVCSSWAYLEDSFRQQTLKVFPKADRVVWCNNDFNVPFHGYHLGRVRMDAHLCALSSVAQIADRFASPIFDWNRLTYTPRETPASYDDRLARIYYYGTLRPGRLRHFDRSFPAFGPRLTLSSANGIDAKRYAERYPTIEVTKREEDIVATLEKYYATVIFEDKFAWTNYVSPPNRFYEALSAGTAMFFEPEAVEMWSRYGYDIRPFLIPDNPEEMLDRAKAVARKQRKWRRMHDVEMNTEFKKLLPQINKQRFGLIGTPEGAKRYI